MNAERLIDRHSLPNGLILELWDHSRAVTGDRWYVVLETRIAIPVRADTLPADLKPIAGQVIMALGDEVIFSQREERNFIASSELTALLQDMQDRILKLAPGYFAHGDFGARFIRKAYGAWQERQLSRAAGNDRSNRKS